MVRKENLAVLKESKKGKKITKNGEATPTKLGAQAILGWRGRTQGRGDLEMYMYIICTSFPYYYESYLSFE